MSAYAHMLRSVPIYGGLTRLSFNTLTNRVFARIDGSLVATMLDGTRIEVDPSDFDGRVLYLFGVCDRKVYTVAKSLLSPRDCFLDIGANYGTIGLLVASAHGSNVDVHLIEPQSLLCHRLELVLKRFEFPNVSLHRVALLDRDGQVTLARPRDHSGMATLVSQPDREDWISEVVEAREAATYLPGLVRGRPFGAKLDVEGAEPLLMPWLLEQPNLRFLLFEAKSNQEDLLSLVRESGATLYGLRRTALRCRIRRVTDTAGISQYYDFVAVRLPPGERPPDNVHPVALRDHLGPR